MQTKDFTRAGAGSVAAAVFDPVTISTGSTNVLSLTGLPTLNKDILRLRGTVGAGGGLTHLVIRTRLAGNGTWRTYLEDADLDTPTYLLPYTSYDGNTSVYQTGAGGSFELALDVRGIHDLQVAATGSSETTVTMEMAM